MKKKILAIALIFTSISAHAGFINGTELMQDLEADQRGEASYDVGVATGYIMGVADTAEGVLLCIPAKTSVKQTKQVVFNYMKSHPESWSKSAEVVIINALKNTWPCEKK
jgi:hypothetical protein